MDIKPVSVSSIPPRIEEEPKPRKIEEDKNEELDKRDEERREQLRAESEQAASEQQTSGNRINLSV